MNILIFSWRGLGHPDAGGAESVIHHHAKAWVKAGHKVTLFTSFFKGAKPEEMIDGVVIKRQGGQYLSVHVKSFFWYIFQKQKFDLVIDNFHGLPFFIPLYVRSKKIAFIQEVTKEVWFLNPLTWPLNLTLGVIGYFSEPLIFLLYKKIPFMTASKSTEDDLASLGIAKNNITIVPHGVVVREPTFKLKEKKQTITYFGVLSKDKGIEDALKCFSLLDKARHGDFNFWVIGRPETMKYRLKLNELIKKLGLTGKIKMWGFVPEDLKFKLLAKSHVLINPSVREGWGLVVIEGAAMGTPTIGYNVPGLRDSILNNQTGIICQENTAENLCFNVIKLLDDKSRYNQMCLKAIKMSKQFSWEKSVNDSLRLIEKIGKAK